MYELCFALFGFIFGIGVRTGILIIRRAREVHSVPPPWLHNAAQRENKAAYEANKAHHPVVASLRVQRRARRAFDRVSMEDNPFDQP